LFAAFLLVDQINNRIRQLKRFDLGTKSNIAFDCGFARRNPQWLGVLNLFSVPEVSRSNFFVNLKAQSIENIRYNCDIILENKISAIHLAC
jgi:hypothetical protein